MASEAQRLIGISLTKIAQSRQHRGGVSLHKNLLVATVLQKARYIFMEEAYNMVHYQQQQHLLQQQQQQQPPSLIQQASNRVVVAPGAPLATEEDDQQDLVGLTAEEAGLEATSSSLPDDVVDVHNHQDSTVHQQPSGSDSPGAAHGGGGFQDFLQPVATTCVKCTENQTNVNKENHPPYHPASSSTELTYLDLDQKSSSNVLRERSNSPSCLKRRRTVSEWETEEAVQSILPKRTKHQEDEDDQHSEQLVATDDSVFLDNDDASTALSDSVNKELLEEEDRTGSATSPGAGSAMEIDRITSLVSIFSFSMGGGAPQESPCGKLNRSMSTPDLCSAQAKDVGDTMQQRPFLAMTV